MKKVLLTILLFTFTVSINAQNKPYITKVYDFMPAPGQFINNIPYVEEPVSKDSILTLVAECICGYVKANGKVVVADAMISLGSFGGYVVFGFDHPVVNVKGEYDLQIFGNAFKANSSTIHGGGSSEPGIVMVSRDVNGNGIPDDPWYELAGSEYNHPKTQKHFTVTYYKPDDSQFGPLQYGQYYDQYIRWTSNSVDSLQEGFVRKNYFNQQSYWPQWIENDSLTFEGTKLRGNAVNEGGNGSEFWVQYFFDWGYVDNRPDDWYGYKNNAAGIDASELNKGFKLDWAVDDDGNHVELKTIDFVKVYNAMLQDCGILGETSTEMAGAVDLHPDAVAEPDAVAGDVNGDGEVTATDVTTLYNWLLNNDDSALVNGDQNGDGEITSADVTFVYNILLGN